MTTKTLVAAQSAYITSLHIGPSNGWREAFPDRVTQTWFVTCEIAHQGVIYRADASIPVAYDEEGNPKTFGIESGHGLIAKIDTIRGRNNPNRAASPLITADGRVQLDGAGLPVTHEEVNGKPCDYRTVLYFVPTKRGAHLVLPEGAVLTPKTYEAPDGSRQLVFTAPTNGNLQCCWLNELGDWSTEVKERKAADGGGTLTFFAQPGALGAKIPEFAR